MVRRAADGIASTATTMATSLDEAVEQLFVGWTPAPPAPDHTSYETSPSAPMHHRIQKPSGNSQRSVAASANGMQTCAGPQLIEPAAAQQKADQKASDGWGEWESPFDSASTSPDSSSQGHNPNAQVAIPAWRADDVGGAQPAQHQHVRSHVSAFHDAELPRLVTSLY